jgi:hypothetical protein
MSDYPRGEVEAHFSNWRGALDERDLVALSQMLSLDARGGNSVFGILEGREAIVDFMTERWPESVPNRGLWVAIDGTRIVHKWRETFPGTPPSGRSYHYDGISEFIYAGDGQWDFMYGLPDVVGLQGTYARWREDGQEKVYGEVYPGM